MCFSALKTKKNRFGTVGFAKNVVVAKIDKTSRVTHGKEQMTSMVLVELDQACLEADTSPDFNPIVIAKDSDFCEHGLLFSCSECGTDCTRVQPTREAKIRAYEHILFELRLSVEENVVQHLDGGSKNDTSSSSRRDNNGGR